MTAPSKIIPFAFEDQLVRVYKPNGEPWFVGRDVCRVLEIKNESDALKRLDTDERQDGVAITDPMGREQSVIVVSEPGVFRLIFASRKPEAERFKRWLAHEVLPALRKQGFYGTPAREPDPLVEFPAADGPLSEHMAKLATLRECRMIHGPRAAARLWKRLGMPVVEESVIDADVEGRRCLAVLLDQVVIEDKQFGRHKRLRDLIERALNEDFKTIEQLRDDFGVRVMPEEDGFVVANASVALHALYHGTPWADHRWRAALRLLPGARPGMRTVIEGLQRRGTFLPAALIDDIPPPAPAGGNVVPLNV